MISDLAQKILSMFVFLCGFLAVMILTFFPIPASSSGLNIDDALEMLEELTIREESRCSSFDRKLDYHHSPRVEKKIVRMNGGIIYGPYEDRVFNSIRETDIEHIVAVSEAHDSGLCEPDRKLDRHRIANDLLNLTLASPRVNRYEKRDKDAGEWMPDNNQCWFAYRVVRVKSAYRLSVDQIEYDALKMALRRC